MDVHYFNTTPQAPKYSQRANSSLLFKVCHGLLGTDKEPNKIYDLANSLWAFTSTLQLPTLPLVTLCREEQRDECETKHLQCQLSLSVFFLLRSVQPFDFKRSTTIHNDVLRTVTQQRTANAYMHLKTLKNGVTCGQGLPCVKHHWKMQGKWIGG